MVYALWYLGIGVVFAGVFNYMIPIEEIIEEREEALKAKDVGLSTWDMVTIIILIWPLFVWWFVKAAWDGETEEM